LSVARKWVFPIIRIVLVAAIAAALVKVAFFPDTAEASNPAVPTGQIVEPQIPVALGTITNDVTLPGTVQADPAVAVRATGIGTVDEVFAAAGQEVAAGDKLYDIKVETIREPVETTGPDGQITVTQPRPTISFAKVLAPISGVLSSLTVLHGQSVAVGDTGGQIAPPTFSVSGSLSPDQQYRLLTQPTEASIAITNGPAPFTCTGLAITTPLAGADTAATPGAATPPAGGGSGTTVRCAIPSGVTVFAGLAAQITIAGGKAENVLVVPTTAVKGSAETGVVWLINAEGAAEERPVTLGMSDGANVQIVEGVAEGDLINQFVPGAVAPDANGCTPQPDGSMVCSGGGFGG
jgi:macrolide-specific efflux system membrane fusion protein